jgi:hypothetical protein
LRWTPPGLPARLRAARSLDSGAGRDADEVAASQEEGAGSDRVASGGRLADSQLRQAELRQEEVPSGEVHTEAAATRSSRGSRRDGGCASIRRAQESSERSVPKDDAGNNASEALAIKEQDQGLICRILHVFMRETPDSTYRSVSLNLFPLFAFSLSFPPPFSLSLSGARALTLSLSQYTLDTYTQSLMASSSCILLVLCRTFLSTPFPLHTFTCISLLRAVS